MIQYFMLKGQIKSVPFGDRGRALRFKYATITLMSHLSSAYVQHKLGHSSISIAVYRYCYWIPGEGRVDLEGALKGGGRKSNRKV